MSNTQPLDPQGSSQTPGAGWPGHSPGNPPGPASSPAPAPPSPPPGQGSAGAQVAPPGLFARLGERYRQWRQRQAQAREQRRMQAQGQSQGTAPAPANTTPQVQPAAPAPETGIDDAELMKRERNKRIRMISDFVDVKEPLDHRIKRYLASAACFVVPWLLVMFLTADVGKYFAGGKEFSLADWETVGVYGLVALLEIVIAVVTNAWGNTVHDLHATEEISVKRSLRSRAWMQGTAWAILSLVSGFALYMYLMDVSHADFSANPAHVNIILRVLGTLAIDPACVFAVHVTHKNLDQFLKQQAEITNAITAISDAFDKQVEAEARAEMRRKENERFLALKGKMDDVNAELFGKMGEKLLEMTDQAFDRMQLPPGRIVDADDDEDEGRNVRRLRR